MQLSFEECKRELKLLMSAGSGLIIVKSMEQERVVDLVDSCSDGGVVVWKSTRGWVRRGDKYSDHNESGRYSDDYGYVSLKYGAVNKGSKKQYSPIMEFDWFVKGNTDLSSYNSSVIQWVDNVVDSDNGLREFFSDLSYQLPNTNKRIILNVDIGWEPGRGLDHVPVIELGLPTISELVDIIHDQLSSTIQESFDVSIPEWTNDDLRKIASNATGLTAFEFETAFSIVAVKSITDGDFSSLSASDFSKALFKYKSNVFSKIPSAKLVRPGGIDDVVGLDGLKHHINVTKAAILDSNGCKKPNGLLLVGEPGTAKTTIAKSIGSVLDIPTVMWDVSSIFDKYVGGTASKLKSTLSKFRAAAPFVCVIDEVHLLFRSGSNSHDTKEEVLGTLQAFMSEDNGIYFVMIANDPTGLPSAFVRSGRIDKVFHVGLPKKKVRKSIVDNVLVEMGIDTDDSEKIASESTGYSGAELENAVINTHREYVYASKGSHLNSDDILKVLKSNSPSSVKDKTESDIIREWCNKNALSADAEPLFKNKSRTRKRRLLS